MSTRLEPSSMRLLLARAVWTSSELGLIQTTCCKQQASRGEAHLDTDQLNTTNHSDRCLSPVQALWVARV